MPHRRLVALLERGREIGLEVEDITKDGDLETEFLRDSLIDDPDCLAELEFTFSVFRFRYTWGTVYEFTFSNLSDAEERKCCFRLIPASHVYLETVETDTMGVGANGITREVTHRYIAADY